MTYFQRQERFPKKHQIAFKLKFSNIEYKIHFYFINYRESIKKSLRLFPNNFSIQNQKKKFILIIWYCIISGNLVSLVFWENGDKKWRWTLYNTTWHLYIIILTNIMLLLFTIRTPISLLITSIFKHAFPTYLSSRVYIQ